MELTDCVEELVEGLKEGIIRADLEGVATASRLDWNDFLDGQQQVQQKYDVILGVECVYNSSHGPALVATIAHLLSPSGAAWIVAKDGRVGLPTFIAAVEASPVLEVSHESTVPDACVAEAQLYHEKCMSEVPFHLFKITLKSPNLQ